MGGRARGRAGGRAVERTDGRTAGRTEGRTDALLFNCNEFLGHFICTAIPHQRHRTSQQPEQGAKAHTVQ